MFFRALMRTVLRVLFRVEVRGLDHYAAAGERVLTVINPSSLLDAVLIGTLLPDRMTLIVNANLMRKWWMRPILAVADTVELDFESSISTRGLIQAVQKHKRCMVFHDELFYNGPHFMRILEATGLIADKSQATILPVHIDGAQYSHFSYFRHKVRLHWFPKVTLTVLPPQSIEGSAEESARERRKRVANQLYQVMCELRYRSARIDQNILQAFCDAVAIYGRSYIIAEDQDRITLKYGPMLTKVQALGRTLGRELKKESRVGFLLPNSLAGAVCFFALHVREKVPAMLNFTAGIPSVLAACSTVQLRSIVTSRKFLKLADLGALEQALLQAGLRLIYLEDVAAAMPLRDKISGALASLWRWTPKTSPEKPVAILFTSGSEGLPKAVFMSHRNARANHEQLFSVITITAGDRFFNCLPMFHTFGLGVGTLLPLVSGMRVFLYPSPLHYRMVPQLFYESLSTVICGTDTFFAGYARYGEPYDFFNARYVIAGAEKLRESTAHTWKERYGVSILEGYGATETSPVISVNTPARTRPTSVGGLLPGMEFKLKPVPGVDDAGVLWVRGDNVMLGYMYAERPGLLEAPSDTELRQELQNTQASLSENEVQTQVQGWYNTGDIVHVDTENVIFIKGRAKRFAKVGGEMISLAAVEQALQEIWPDTLFGVVAVPDPRKGEQLVLIIEAENISPGQIATFFARRGYSPLWTPKRILSVKQVPLLGAGKFDYTVAKEMAQQAYQAG